VNEIGNYHCVCPHGYMLLPNGSKCNILVTADMLSEMGSAVENFCWKAAGSFVLRKSHRIKYISSINFVSNFLIFF
jgi:retron-type reverse transcriptase